MGEKFAQKFESQESLAQNEQEAEKGLNQEQFTARDFFYNSAKREILIYSEEEGKRKEKRHPFQEFLYELRREEIKVSTSEWLDLQKALAKGEIQTIDDFYLISRALLVKDVTGYPRFDTVFGRMFYGIEPPDPQEEEEQDDYEDYEDEETEAQEEEEEEEEEREVSEEENLSQEIVEPGFTEEHHGGKDAHKSIKDSKSSGYEVGEKRKEKKEEQGIIRKGKGCYSARERVIERRYDQFDKGQTLNYGQLGMALAKIVSIIQEASETLTDKLDTKETVKKIAQNAGLPELVWREEQEKKPKVILMFDVGGSTDEFRPIMEKLFSAVKDYLDDVEIYYFHNAIYGEVWPPKDGNYGKHFLPLTEILKKESDSKVIIIGDAWMAADELWEDYEDYDEKTGNKKHCPSGMDSFKEIQKTFDNVVWINPIPERKHDEIDNSGTISDIKEVFSMYNLTLSGIEKAVKELMKD